MAQVINRATVSNPTLATKRAGKEPSLSNDEMRTRILRLLYDERIGSAARKRYNWRDLRMKVRNELEFSPSKTTHNLQYLIQNDWIEKEVVPYTGPMGRAYGTVKKLHAISTKAIDLFEEGSAYSQAASLYGLVITGDHNLVQVGANLFAHQGYQDLQVALSSLFEAIVLSEDLTTEQKLGVTADIKAIQSQLLKENPDKSLLNNLKENLQWLANVAGISSFLINLSQYWPF